MEKMRKLSYAVIALLLLVMAGCKTAPIYNVTKYPSPKPVSLEVMEEVIMTTGTQAGWEMASIKPGLIEGTWRIRNGKHVAIVSIPYDENHYSILYKSSINLKDDGKGNIHKKYNAAVQSLDNSIRTALTVRPDAKK